jgi:hypothetical protein
MPKSIADITQAVSSFPTPAGIKKIIVTSINDPNHVDVIFLRNPECKVGDTIVNTQSNSNEKCKVLKII